MNGDDLDEAAIAEQMREFGYEPVPGEIGRETRKWKKAGAGRPTVRVPLRCPRSYFDRIRLRIAELERVARDRP